MQPLEWKGAESQRFSGGRQHIRQEGELTQFMHSNSMQPSFGIRTFSDQPSATKEFRPCLKVFENSYHLNQKEIDPRGVKCALAPSQVERFRRELGHVVGGSQTKK